MPEAWKGTMRIGDGPEIPFVGPPPVVIEHDLDATGYVHQENPDYIRPRGPRVRWVTAEDLRQAQDLMRAGGLRVDFTVPVEGDIDAAIQRANEMVERHVDRARERRLGVDPGRVIDGETVQKEIEA